MLNGRLSEVNFWKNCFEWDGSCDWSGWLFWVHGCDWLDSTFSASAGGKGADPRSAFWFGVEDADPMLLGEVTNTSTVLFVTAPHETELDIMSMTLFTQPLRSGRIWHKGEGKVGHEPRLEPCWTMLLQCEPDEPCRIWTQTWVQAQIPDYSLNWTKRSSAIQFCEWHYRPPEGSSAKAVWRCRSSTVFVTASHQTGLDTSSMTRRSIIVGVEGKECRARAETQTMLDYAGHRLT